MMAATTTTSSPQCSSSQYGATGAFGVDNGVTLAWNTSSAFGYGFGFSGYNNYWDTSTTGAAVDQMDSLFEDDWLHENNLDILFDLFEEEIESSSSSSSSSSGSSCHYGSASAGGSKSTCIDNHSHPSQLNSHTNNTTTSGNINGSSNILGSSPITSYLFGTSPSLASALDLYDFLYFDNQQQQQQTSSATNEMNCTSYHNCSTNTSTNCHTTSCMNHSKNGCNLRHVDQTTSSSNQVHKLGAGNNQHHPHSTIATATNSMRIKRKVKKGQSEGVSLLIKPFSTTKSNSNIINTNNNNIHKNNVVKHSKSHNDIHSNNNINNHHVKPSNSINKNKSDKTSTKITNFMNTIIGNHSSTNTVNIKRIINSPATINTTSNSVTKNEVTAKTTSSNSDCNSGKSSSSSDNLCPGKEDCSSTKKNHHTHDRYIHSFHKHVHYISGCSIIREHAYALRGH